MIRFNDLLREIGDTTDYYKFRRVSENIREMRDGTQIALRYRFKTENRSYVANVYKSPISKYLEVDFTTKKGGGVTNEGKQFKVVSTTIKIALDALDFMKKEGFEIKGFQFMPIPKDHSTPLDAVTQREKLYLAFIRRQFPQANVRRESGTVFVDIK
jgi:hypothetical protein